MTPLAQLKQRYLSKTKRLRYTPGLEGQRLKADGTICIGNRAGPSLSLANLIHEMSHFVEIDDGRMTQYGWGLVAPKVWVYNRFCCEPVTKKMTERELRVIAYQVNVLESLGLPDRPIYSVRSLVFMPDFTHIPLEDGRSAYGDDAPTWEEMDSRAKDESRIRWMVNRVGQLRAEYTLERFDREWDRKVEVLERAELSEASARF